ncbi:MAG: ThuA domain-containing protein [Anaerolineae bacterium]|nr:ThuA domain-containing protein [Anaerolineae bacterium]
MQVLVLCDDRWHPAPTPRQGLAPLETEGVALDWIEDAREWNVERMAAYPVVILTKSNNFSAADQTPWVTPEVESALVDYVHQGGGLLVIHSGAAGYAETPGLRALMGGVFTSHPSQCPVTVTPVAGHLLTQGVSPFTLQDEHYFMAQDDVEADVFLTTTSEHGTQPGGWTRVEGKGRVCMLTPGHNVDVWLHPSFQALLRNALRWLVQEVSH